MTTYSAFFAVLNPNAIALTLLPGESHVLAASWKDAFMPVGRDLPPIANQLMGEITARIIYRFSTDEGNWWSESVALPPGDFKDL